MAKIRYRDGLRLALTEEMTRDPLVFVMGEGIAERGGSFKVTEGLLTQFGPGRVIDTPLSEAGFTGMGAGAAIAGARPVIEILFIDFLLQAMDQVVNQAAKYRFMSGGQGTVPVVFRTQGGAGESLAGQHSQSLEAMFYHVPGLQVVMPSTPYDAKGLLKSAIRSDQPVVFIEHKLLYMTEGEVPDEEYLVPLGVADIKRTGTDVTVVTYSLMTLRCLDAAERLAEEGISVEVVDLRTPSARWICPPSSPRSAGPIGWSWSTKPSSGVASVATSPPRSRRRHSTASWGRSCEWLAGTPPSPSTWACSARPSRPWMTSWPASGQRSAARRSRSTDRSGSSRPRTTQPEIHRWPSRRS